MEYIVYKRFKGKGIDGQFNLPFGTPCLEINGFIYTLDGRAICATISETGWEHFRPNTDEGKKRVLMLEQLYKYYSPGAGKKPLGMQQRILTLKNGLALIIPIGKIYFVLCQ